MSRIGKMPVVLPKGVEVKQANGTDLVYKIACFEPSFRALYNFHHETTLSGCLA